MKDFAKRSVLVPGRPVGGARTKRRLRLEALEARWLLAAPEALPDQYVTLQDQTIDILPVEGVLINDSDADGDPLTAELVNDVGHGTLTFDPDGSFVYDPDPDFFGTDTFTYEAISTPQTWEYVFTVDPVQSLVDVDAEITAQGLSDTDSDTTHLSGTVTATLTPSMSPFDTAHITDLDIRNVDQLDFDFSFGFWPVWADIAVDVSANDLHVTMDEPGPEAVVNAQGVFDQLQNILHITAHATVDCSGTLCGEVPDVIDVDDPTDPPIDLENARVSQTDSTIELFLPISFTYTAVDEETGDGVTLVLDGQIVGTATAVDPPPERSAETTVSIDVISKNPITGRGENYRVAEDHLLMGQAAPTVAEEVVLPAGWSWNYLDDGSDQSLGWRFPAYDDSGWASGLAELGYGDGDETTTVDFGGDDANKHITTYFRSTFNVVDAHLVDQLQIELLRDDGAAVYINGEEVVRDNLAPGAGASTLALNTVNDADESTFFPFTVDLATLPEGTLVEGLNTVAVEIHQASAGSSDISFDMRIKTLRSDVGVLGNDRHRDALPLEAVLVNPTQNGVLALAPDGTFTYTPAPEFSGADRFLYVAAETGTMIVPPGADWRYLDDGSDQGTAWRAAGFGDAGWEVGPAQLGYGDGDEATTVDFIDTDLVAPDVQKNITTYFRHQFNVADAAALGELTLNVLRDDGVAVYLNGSEVGRDSLDADAPFDLPANDTIGGGDENEAVEFTIPAGTLLNGPNVLAVEIHQASDTSSDITFDLWLSSEPTSGVLTAAVEVLPVNDPPLADDDGPYETMLSETLVVDAASGVLVGDADVEDDLFDARRIQAPQSGSLTLNPDGSFEYEPAQPGLQSFRYAAVEQTTTVMVPTGAAWKFLDDGSDQGTAWRGAAFDDSTWTVGPAQLGYGDGDEQTVVRFGADPLDKHITTYFRHTFHLDNAANWTDLAMQLWRDDGAAVYLNGSRIALDNLADGAAYDTVALGDADADGNTPVVVTSIPRSLLVNGPNVLAVEIHQSAPDSSDISFDLELTGHVQSLAATVTIDVEIEPAQFVDAYLFYNNSAFDAVMDDDAIATDKQPLRPGEQATPANVSSYESGINGVMIDIEDLSPTPSINGFQTHVASDLATSEWTPVTIGGAGLGVGVGGSDRVKLTFADGLVVDQWLRVTIVPGAQTGLEQPEVFYFGSAVGDTGNSADNVLVTAADVIAVRDNPRGPGNRATIDSPYDLNRDAMVNAADALVARNHASGPFDALTLGTAPVAAPPPAEAEGEAGPLAGPFVADRRDAHFATAHAAMSTSDAVVDRGAIAPTTVDVVLRTRSLLSTARDAQRRAAPQHHAADALADPLIDALAVELLDN